MAVKTQLDPTNGNAEFTFVDAEGRIINGTGMKLTHDYIRWLYQQGLRLRGETDARIPAVHRGDSRSDQGTDQSTERRLDGDAPAKLDTGLGYPIDLRERRNIG